MQADRISLGRSADSYGSIDSHHLAKHAVILGSTGSGKTGYLVSIIEQLAEKGIPSFLIDIKGDLVNLATLPIPNVDVRILTPKASHGLGVSVLCGDPKSDASTIASLVGLSDVQQAYLSECMRYASDPSRLIGAILDPPFEHVGALPLSVAVPLAKRKALAIAINNLLLDQDASWFDGIPLDIATLWSSNGSKTPIVVYSVAHLGDTDRELAIGAACSAFVRYMRSLQGSDSLQGVLAIDEVFGLLPSHPAKSVPKPYILTLLKQARSVGLGVILASQNPSDIDYRALSNCNTWIVGRLSSERDQDKASKGLALSNGMSESEIRKKIGELEFRNFLVSSGSKLEILRSHNTKTKLTGPWDIQQIQAHTNQFLDKIRKNNEGKIRKILTEQNSSVTFFSKVWKKICFAFSCAPVL